jgi:tetratricopeptide (TPR) repeat protein
MASLFLSYCHEDLKRVEALAKALEREGHRVWWDRHLAGGQDFSDSIEEALERADVVVVCWTSRSIRSAWVRDEAGAGRDTGRLVPVSLDGCQPPLGFRQFHTIDLSRWNGKADSRAFHPVITGIAEKTGASEPKVGRTHPVGRISWRRPATQALAGAVLVLLIGAGSLAYQHFSGASGRIDPRVAIGQFQLVSADLPRTLPEILGQEIIASFGAENAVSVIAPSDLKNARSAPFIMDGSVNRLGSMVRFTVNLRNRQSGVILWSASYEHEAADAVAARQAAVGASQVVRCGLWGASSYPKPMPDQAFGLYLKWCNEHWSGSTSANTELDAARRVTVAVPQFSFGWSALALAAIPLVAENSAESGRLRAEAEAAAKKSMSLDSQNPEGYMALAGLLPLGHFDERERLLQKALGVRPTECGCERQAYGDFLASVGRMDDAVEQYERARAMRPLAPFSNVRFAQALYVVGRNDEADGILDKMLALWSDATSLRLLKIKSALWTRRYDEAVEGLNARDLPLTSVQRTALADAFLALKSGDPQMRAQSIAALNEFANDRRYNDKVVVATLAALGARQEAIRAAANLVRTRGLFDAEVLFEPNLAESSGDPSYGNLVRSLGLLDYWRSASNPPDLCRGAEKPAFCSLA